MQPTTLALMFQPHFQLHPLLTGMGLGIIVDRIGGQRVVWHNGGWPGWSSMLLLAPAARIGVTLLSNLMLLDGALDQAADRVMRLCLGAPAPEQELTAAPVEELQRAHWPLLSGYYGPPGTGLVGLLMLLGTAGGLEITTRGDRLQIGSPLALPGRRQALHPIPDEPLAFRGALAGRPATVAFQQNGTEQAVALCIGLQRFPRGSSWRNPRRLLLGAGLAASIAAVVRVRRRRGPRAHRSARRTLAATARRRL